MKLIYIKSNKGNTAFRGLTITIREYVAQQKVKISPFLNGGESDKEELLYKVASIDINWRLYQFVYEI